MPKSQTTDAAVAEPGLRARKKAQTRELIADTARRLFEERGFEAVTVAEVARDADVAEKTVFNYFPTKEDLFYSRLEQFEEELLAAIRERKSGQSVIGAFREFITRQRGALQIEDDAEATNRMRAVNRVITESPALLAREQQVFARYTDSLARLIAEETRTGADAAEPWVVANGLMGVHRDLIAYVRNQTQAGTPAKDTARRVRTRAKRAFALLEQGLADYAVKA
jgi:AcrR family transcriptional regulator